MSNWCSSADPRTAPTTGARPAPWPAGTKVNPATVTIQSLSRIPGSTRQLAGGFTHASGNRGANVVAALWQYS